MTAANRTTGLTFCTTIWELSRIEAKFLRRSSGLNLFFGTNGSHTQRALWNDIVFSDVLSEKF